MTKKSSGFTVIEILFIIVILGVASVFFFIQKNDLEVSARDNTRKTAINAMYYSLEEVFYKNNGYYPSEVNSTILPSVDPTLLKDPEGVIIGESTSNYRYEPSGCTDSKCSSYTLRATLENEAEYIKTNFNKK